MMSSRLFRILGLSLFLLLGFDSATPGVQVDTGIQLLPLPREMVQKEGYFTLSRQARILAHPGAGAAAAFLQKALHGMTGMALAVEPADEESREPNTLRMMMDETLNELGREGYTLRVETDGILIRAPSPEGLFYACQTLRQLLPLPRIIGQPLDRIQWTIPCVAITDQPRFDWRGLMLDCSRTFQSPDYIRKTLDRMAFYKLNVLHLHLTDDQGWRLEIKQYPALTEQGAWFPEKYSEPESRQGFYTQEEMRELVAYAAARNITIVPEIEMPGHSLAALSCYPELSCTGGPFEIHPFFEGPSIHKDIYCAGKEKTFVFLEQVLDEVFEIFPSKFIHIGGDEAPKDRWKECTECQARMKELGLNDENELQSWFIRRIADFAEGHGRTVIGWDEILEGGLAGGAAVMSWRGTEGGITAARAGHPVVMSPTSHLYFDYPYDRIDTRHSYAFEPVPPELEPDQAGNILGLQANFWSHIDREPERVDRQLFPRLLAVAERGWSAAAVRDWEDFGWRLKVHLVHLDGMGISYRRQPIEDKTGGFVKQAEDKTGRIMEDGERHTVRILVEGKEPGK